MDSDNPHYWLVVSNYPLWKMMEWTSVGIMTVPIYGKYWKVIKFHGSKAATRLFWIVQPPMKSSANTNFEHRPVSKIPIISLFLSWLVVLTILKNISQWEGFSHILWKIKNVWNHQPASLLLAKPPYKYGIQTYLVGGFNLPLWRMMERTSVRMVTFPAYGKIKNHVPNHQDFNRSFEETQLADPEVF